MFRRAATVSLCAAALGSVSFAQEGAVPQGIPHLDHVFVIMMENHGYGQIMNNPDAPFINRYTQRANLGTNYFAIGHPSLTNYLEAVGGSNFGVRDDNAPDWHNSSCTPNIMTGAVSLESTSAPICPIYGSGTDAETPAIDTTNETTDPKGAIDIDGTRSVPANPNTVGKTIADQLTRFGMTWKSYQESLPPGSSDNINTSDGYYTDKSDLSAAFPGQKITHDNLAALYAAKHNPFAYFRSIQEGGLGNVAGFDGNGGLWADLRRGDLPNYALIAPNQCNDMHGRGNVTPACQYDPNDNGTQTGLNPGLIRQGDRTVQNIVGAIHSSPGWKNGRNAIVLVWDENDYSITPTTNQVIAIVDTNYGPRGLRSSNYYDHFSLLKSIEAGLSLPCLNHACDTNVSVMSDLFSAGDGSHHSSDDEDR